MEITETKLPGCYIIEPQVFGDPRGWFYESFSKRKLPELKFEFVQDNHSYTQKKGTLRGIHFQNIPKAQGKLVRCVRGAVNDVAVDLRRDSLTYKQWIMMELSAENRKMLYLPRGFGHGVVSLTDDTELLYKMDDYYAPEAEGGIRWNDPDLAVDWGVYAPILLEKDQALPWLRDAEINF